MLQKQVYLNGQVFFGLSPDIMLNTNDQNYWLNGQSVNFVFIRIYLGKALNLF